jgi:hypothetical protein
LGLSVFQQVAQRSPLDEGTAPFFRTLLEQSPAQDHPNFLSLSRERIKGERHQRAALFFSAPRVEIFMFGGKKSASGPSPGAKKCAGLSRWSEAAVIKIESMCEKTWQPPLAGVSCAPGPHTPLIIFF